MFKLPCLCVNIYRVLVSWFSWFHGTAWHLYSKTHPLE